VGISSVDYEGDTRIYNTYTDIGADEFVLDTDSDGLTDEDEISYSTNPLIRDSDGDGLADGGEITNNTLPLVADSDGDGYSDFLEVLRDSIPTAAGSHPKWENDTFIRRILPGLGVLESVVASYGYKQSNSLVINNPDNIQLLDVLGIEADVTVTEIHSKTAHTRARLGGFFYNSGGREIFAEVGIRQTDTGLMAFYEIGSCGDSSCDDWEEIAYQFITPAQIDQAFTLSIRHYQTANLFIFGFEGQEYQFGETDGLPNNDGQPTEAIRLIGTRVGGIAGWNDESGGYVRALFDNAQIWDQIEQRFVSYDSFDGPRIDQDNWLPANDFKWQTWEFVRRADDGYIQSAVANYNNNQSSNLGIVNPETIGGFRTDVSVTGFDNNAAWTGARAIAVIYNDGTQGLGARAGDIVVGVGVGNTGTDLNGYYQVVRCLSGDCSLPGEYESIVYEPAFFSAEQDRLYTVGMNWDPATNQIEFSYTDHFNSTGHGIIVGNLPISVSLPQNPFRGVGTRVSSIDAAGEYGYIRANFENVQITDVLNAIADFDNDGTPDVYDSDDDNDGLDDDAEAIFGSDPYNSDSDSDGYNDFDDNCPADSNPASDWLDANSDLHTATQADYDLDGFGDACDDDDDNDGVDDPVDNCPTGPNPGQEDLDDDGLGDVCDKDADGDRYVDWIYYEEGVIEPNCNPGAADPSCVLGYDCDDTNTDPAFLNGDCTGEFKPNKTTTIVDTDNDGDVDTSDNCPNVANSDQADGDSDGLGDACDACPDDPQNDIDGDGICGNIDGCPNEYNAGSDFDGDGMDDACDPDADQDGSLAQDDCNDLNPMVRPGAAEISDGLDNNCDGQVDEGLSAYSVVFEIDGDDPDQAKYNDWLPVPGASVMVKATVVDHEGVPVGNQPVITFTALPPTTYPGDFTNHSEVYVTPDIDHDFVANNPEFSLIARDYGGAIRIRAEASVDNFLAQGEFKLPKDIDNDGLPDKFENDFCGNLATLASAAGDHDGDGISNINELRGFWWGPPNLEVDPGVTNTTYDSWYQTGALVPHGTVAHFRTNPTRKDLFIQVKGYFFQNYNGGALAPTVPGLDYDANFDLTGPADRIDIDLKPDAQFALGWAFKNAGVDAHVASLDAAVSNIDLGLLENNIDFFLVNNNLTNPKSGTGHITKIGIRDATWSLKGFSLIGNADTYGVGTGTYQLPLDYMFADRIWQDDSESGEEDMLDWVNVVEDVNDNGLDDYVKAEKAYESEIFGSTSSLDGDLYIFNIGYGSGLLSVFDIDNDGMVELPLADNPQDPANGTYEKEYTKLQVLKHTITHECGHAVGMSHTSVPQDVMYEYSIDWGRDNIFSDSAKAVMRIHNQ
jgi:Thrombospondin type 3 repeat